MLSNTMNTMNIKGGGQKEWSLGGGVQYLLHTLHQPLSPCLSRLTITIMDISGRYVKERSESGNTTRPFKHHLHHSLALKALWSRCL